MSLQQQQRVINNLYSECETLRAARRSAIITRKIEALTRSFK
jgi:hypothetical protein